jgi:glycosyltransferase involved in cell wall biosynthesis
LHVPGATLLSGRTIALVHPAWHSCGTATVVAGQARAYRALGARVISLALSDQPVFGLAAKSFGRAYREATPELVADRRLLTGVARSAFLNPLTIGPIGWSFAHGDHAATYVGFAKSSAVPAELTTERIDIIHCNHFFCMPMAERLRASHGCPVFLDTHDIQAKQYVLRNAHGWYLPPRATYEAMLATELAWLRRADLLIHLNSEEEAFFRRALPESSHTLLWPAVDSMPTGLDGSKFVIVASANVANILSLEWFLREVMPSAGNVAFAIYGNIDSAIRSRDPSLYERYARHFRGRVEEIGEAYTDAACVLLPCVEGHGLSIKTVEALSTGAPLIATPLAFRGMDVDLEALSNVTLAEDAPAFAEGMRMRAAEHTNSAARAVSPTRRLYEARFSAEAYEKALAQIVGGVLADPSALSRQGVSVHEHPTTL